MGEIIKTGILSKGEKVSDTYEVQSLIGQGAFGEVYKVKHKYLGVQVLKVFRQEYVENTDINTVTSEAKILSKLTHPNIVRVFETNTFKKDGQTFFFITMGFVPGETLAQLLRRKIRIPVPIALTIQSDFLTGLQVAHKHESPIVHRDISPDNILLSYESEKPRAMLSDFGLAQSFDQVSSIPRAAGKYPYMAPECFWGTYLLTSDVFSAGIVLYRMLTGMMPWEYDFEGVGDNAEDIMTMIIVARKTQPRKPSLYCDTCDEKLDEVVLKAVSTDLEKRYKNAGEFLEAIKNAQAPTDIPRQVDVENEHSEYETTRRHKIKAKGKGFDEIAGMNEIKDILYQDVILPLSEKELYEQYKISVPNGIMLYGPPGCGKTFIAERFADEIEYKFYQIRPSDLASTYIHGTQEKIGQLFREARKKAPSIIFIDEIDAIVPNRETHIDHAYASEVNEFLAQMTECHQHGIFIIAATNAPEKIDPAILRTGRIDKVVYVGPPDYEARVEMFKLYLKERPIGTDIDYETLANMTQNYVSSDIKFITNEASRNALKERIKIQQLHLEKAIKTTPSSISEKQLQKYEKFKHSRSFE
jgi:transitional endoplasmic reticulum ATPase